MIGLITCLITLGVFLIVFPTLRTYLIFFFLILPIGIVTLTLQTIGFLWNYLKRRNNAR
jgi:ABC-type enterobactin transport system permease subunit